MKILITTGLSDKDTGGPFQYAPNLVREFEKMGHEAKIIKFGSIEKTFLGIWSKVFWAETVLSLDTFSVGVPSVIIGRLLGKKTIVRVGGDFLWESYVERTGAQITLRKFNSNMPRLSLKESLIFFFTKILTKFADKLVFNTEWQRNIWSLTYDISYVKSSVVRNFIPGKQEGNEPKNKNFIWAGRKIKLKNIELIRDMEGVEILDNMPHDELVEKIKNCYSVVLPSFSEVCPNFILEAASYNKPFIMTEETGLKEVYNRGGIFINPFDKVALNKAILEMSEVSNYEKYKKELEIQNPTHLWFELAQEFLSLCQSEF